MRLAEVGAKSPITSTWEPTPLDEITAEQKCRVFDGLYRQAVEYVRGVEAGEGTDSDADHYIFESAVEGTLGRDVWDHVNALT